MPSILDMFTKIWFVNIILAVCVVFFGAKGIAVWSDMDADVAQGIQKPSQVKVSEAPRVVWGTLSPENTYEIVAVKDLFNSDRAEPVEEEAEKKDENVEEAAVVEKDVRVSGKKIILYGVVMKADYRTALISDPQPKPQTRPFLWVKEGESIGETDIVVSAIKKESIVLKNKGDLIEISLYDQKKSTARAGTPKQQQQEDKPVVVTTQSTTTGGDIKESGPTPPKPEAAPVEKPNRTVVTSPEGEKYRIIKTPFGNIKRKIE